MSDQSHPPQGAIAMSTLGMNGRFGNQVLQYGFLHVYAQRHGLTVQTPAWLGQSMFDLDDPLVTPSLPLLVDDASGGTLLDKLPRPVRNIDLYGYCQYHTSHFAPEERMLFRSLFTPTASLGTPIDSAIGRLRRGRTLIAIHLRRGDYGHGRYFIAPTSCYRAWLQENWDRWDRPLLYIASDAIDDVLPDFAEFGPVTERDLGIELPNEYGFYADFRVLSRADAVAISNSTFSFAACMLNDRTTAFVRPVLNERKLVPFDPWDAVPVLDGDGSPEEIQNYEPMLAQLHDARTEHAAAPTEATESRLREIRRLAAYIWIGAQTDTLAILYLGTMGAVHRKTALSEVATLPRDATDDSIVADAFERFHSGIDGEWSLQYLLATMLLCSPAELPIDHDLLKLPNWLVSDYIAWLRTVRG